MKLLRATCDCEFHSQKVRVGYHFHRWWFPVLDTNTGQFTDVSRRLPEDQVNEIQLSRVRAEAFHPPFIESVNRELLNQFAGQTGKVFAPKIGHKFRCPKCGHSTLLVDQVRVVAFCKADCGHEFQWHDSEQRGCPICNHRPHRFRVDSEPQFANRPRSESRCPCSSSTESSSYIDAYCPKCGELPVSYDVNGQSFCGMHHTPLQPYKAPSNILFIEAEARWVADQFPNAKLWGDAESEDSTFSAYCPKCEADHQCWIARESAS